MVVYLYRFPARVEKFEKIKYKYRRKKNWEKNRWVKFPRESRLVPSVINGSGSSLHSLTLRFRMRYLVVLDLLFSHFFFLHPLHFFFILFWQDYSGLKKKKLAEPKDENLKKKKKKVMTTKKWNRYIYIYWPMFCFFFLPFFFFFPRDIESRRSICGDRRDDDVGNAPFMISSIPSLLLASFVFTSVIQEKVRTRENKSNAVERWHFAYLRDKQVLRRCRKTFQDKRYITKM